jgi:hypothetical protein
VIHVPMRDEQADRIRFFQPVQYPFGFPWGIDQNTLSGRFAYHEIGVGPERGRFYFFNPMNGILFVSIHPRFTPRY